jgi:chemotaxis protein CheD
MVDKIFLDMGDVRVMEDSETMIAEGVGSCVILILRDGDSSVTGGAHIVLPAGEEENSPKRADSLIDKLLEEIESRGVKKRDLKAKMFGGGHIFGFSESVGQDNVESTKNILEEEGIDLIVEDTGGEKGRNIEYECDTGKAEVCDSVGDCKYY